MDRRTALRSLAGLTAVTAGCLTGIDRGPDPDSDENDGNESDAEPTDGAGDADDSDGPSIDDLRVDETPAETRTVRMTHTGGFVPDVAWVEPGGEVTWRNADDADRHDTVSIADRIPDAADGWGSDKLDRGDSFTHTFPREGVYDYVCTPHRTWMYGTVVVGTPDPESEPGLAEPGDDDALAPSVLESLNRATENLLRNAGD